MRSAVHDDIVLAKLLRQDHAIVVVGAAAIALLGWAYLFYQGWAMQHMDLVVPYEEPDRGPCCKPYGAPPARRRVV